MKILGNILMTYSQMMVKLIITDNINKNIKLIFASFL